MLFSCFTRFLGSYITFFLLNSMLNIMLYSEGGIYYSYLSCYVCAYIVKVVCTALFIMACNMLYWIFHLYWIFRRFNTLYNLLYSTNTDQAPSGWHYSPSQAGIHWQATDSDLYFWSESVPGLQRRGLGHPPGNLHPAAWARIGAAWAGNPRDGFKIFEESIKIDLKYLRPRFAQKGPSMRSGKEPQLPVLVLAAGWIHHFW